LTDFYIKRINLSQISIIPSGPKSHKVDKWIWGNKNWKHVNYLFRGSREWENKSKTKLTHKCSDYFSDNFFGCKSFLDRAESFNTYINKFSKLAEWSWKFSTMTTGRTHSSPIPWTSFAELLLSLRTFGSGHLHQPSCTSLSIRRSNSFQANGRQGNLC